MSQKCSSYLAETTILSFWGVHCCQQRTSSRGDEDCKLCDEQERRHGRVQDWFLEASLVELLDPFPTLTLQIHPICRLRPLDAVLSSGLDDYNGFILMSTAPSCWFLTPIRSVLDTRELCLEGSVYPRHPVTCLTPTDSGEQGCRKCFFCG